MSLKVVVQRGAMRDLRVWIEREERNLIVISVDSNTKRPMISCAMCIDGNARDGKERVYEIAMHVTDGTLRADGRYKRPSVIRVEGLSTGWNIECPTSCRYSFSFVAWRNSTRPRQVYP